MPVVFLEDVLGKKELNVGTTSAVDQITLGILMVNIKR